MVNDLREELKYARARIVEVERQRDAARTEAIQLSVAVTQALPTTPVARP